MKNKKEEITHTIRCDDTYFASSEIQLTHDKYRKNKLNVLYLKVLPQMGDIQTVVLRVEEIQDLIDKLQMIKNELCGN